MFDLDLDRWLNVVLILFIFPSGETWCRSSDSSQKEALPHHPAAQGQPPAAAADCPRQHHHQRHQQHADGPAGPGDRADQGRPADTQRQGLCSVV